MAFKLYSELDEEEKRVFASPSLPKVGFKTYAEMEAERKPSVSVPTVTEPVPVQPEPVKENWWDKLKSGVSRIIPLPIKERTIYQKWDDGSVHEYKAFADAGDQYMVKDIFGQTYNVNKNNIIDRPLTEDEQNVLNLTKQKQHEEYQKSVQQKKAEFEQLPGYEKFFRKLSSTMRKTVFGEDIEGIPGLRDADMTTGNKIADTAADILGFTESLFVPTGGAEATIGQGIEKAGKTVKNIVTKALPKGMSTTAKNILISGAERAGAFGALGAYSSAVNSADLKETMGSIATNALIGGISGGLSEAVPPQLAEKLSKHFIGRSILRGLPGATAFGGFGAVEGVRQGHKPAELARDILTGFVTGYLFDNAIYGAGKAMELGKNKVFDPAIKGVRMRFDVYKNRNVKDMVPVTQTYIRNPNFDFAKNGYIELKPNSGLWLKYDPKTGNLIDTVYEMVVHNGQAVPLYKMRAYVGQERPAQVTPSTVTPEAVQPKVSGAAPAAETAKPAAAVSSNLMPVPGFKTFNEAVKGTIPPAVSNVSASQIPADIPQSKTGSNIITPTVAQDNLRGIPVRQDEKSSGDTPLKVVIPSQPKDIPIDDRNFSNVGDRKVAAYQYLHPEVKPYTQAEAARLLEELKNSEKGERYMTTNDYGESIWRGNKRYTSKAIEQILDGTGATYAEVEKALKALIEDEGAENIALAKKIEVVIDDILSNGTTDIDGYEIPANEEYRATKAQIQGKEYKPKIEESIPGDELPVLNVKNRAFRKEPWEMTPDEFAHREIVKKALAEGKPVPEEVLKHYPDLVEISGRGIDNIAQKNKMEGESLPVKEGVNNESRKIDVVLERPEGLLEEPEEGHGIRSYRRAHRGILGDDTGTERRTNDTASPSPQSRIDADRGTGNIERQDGFQKAQAILAKAKIYLEKQGLKDVHAEIVEPKTEGQKNVRAFLEELGYNVHFFKADNKKWDISGVFEKEYPDTILIRADEDINILQAVGHEFFHGLKVNHPDLYQDVLDAVEDTVTQEQLDAYLEKNFAGMGEYYEHLKNNRKALIEELFADEAGNNFIEKSFWENIYEKSKELFHKLVELVRKFFDGLLNTNKYKFDNLTKEQIEAFRKEFEDVVVEVRYRTTTQRGFSDVGSIKLLARNSGKDRQPTDREGVEVTPEGVIVKDYNAITKSEYKRINSIMKKKGYDWRGADDARALLERMGRRTGIHTGDQAEAIKEALMLDKTPEEKAALEAVKKAVKEFGTTFDFREAGYLTIDGRLLDFSGKREGGPVGRRSLDHREIQLIYDDELTGTDAMLDFMDMGNIRLQADGFEVTQRLTKAQVRRIKEFINNKNGEIYIDLGLKGKHGNAPYTLEYSKGTRADRIFRDIEDFYSIYDAHPEMRAWEIAEAFEQKHPKSLIDEFHTKFSARRKREGELVKPFFSKLQRTIEEKMPNSASVEDIRNFVAANGVKVDEIKWSGLNDFLAGKEKVSKQELLDFLRMNELQVEEVETGGETYKYTEEESREFDRISRELSEANQALVDIYKEMYEHINKKSLPDNELILIALDNPSTRVNRIFQEYIRSGISDEEINDMDRKITAARTIHFKAQMKMDEIVQKAKKRSETRYGKYTLPGGENYREMLFILPLDENSIIINKLEARMDEAQYNLQNAYKAGDEKEIKIWEDEVDKLKLELKKYSTATRRSYYQSLHWTEPNVLAHVRFNDRIDAEGNSVLFIEEIQSDWHQEGRRKGYKDVTREAEAKRAFDAYSQELANKYNLDPSHNLAMYAIIKHMEPAEVQKYEELQNEWLSYGQSAVPDVPFQKTWPEFVLKRMLRYAAENGYDKIAWTTGEQQAERYDLSKQVKYIGWRKLGDNNYNLNVQDMQGNLIYNKTGIGISEIEDVIGKELAQKIALSDKNFDTIEGDGLKVGGEGMKGFYDKMIPDFLNKYGKKWGARVDKTYITQVKTGFIDNVYEGPKYTPKQLRDEAEKAENIRIKSILNDVADTMEKYYRDNRDDYFKFMGEHLSPMAAEYLGGRIVKKDQEFGENQFSLEITPSMKESVLYEGQPLFSIKKSNERAQQAEKSLSELENELDRIVDERLKDKKKKVEGEEFSFKNEETEKRWKAAKDPTKPFLTKVNERLASLAEEAKLMTTRGAFPYLERGARYADLRAKLSAFTKQKSVAMDRTLRNLQAITLNFDKNLYDIFSRKVVLDDITEEIKQGHELAFGFAPEEVNSELKRVNELVNKYPDLNQPLQLRKKVWDSLKNMYITSMDDIGFDVTDRLKRENYYRHLIIDKMNEERIMKGTISLRTPTGSGYLKKRHGSLHDYVSDYLLAEAEVMSNMYYDIKKAKMIKYVMDSEHNIKDSLKKQAKTMNKAALDDIIAKERAEEDTHISKTEISVKRYNQIIAMGYDNLKTLAQIGQLWEGDNGEYKNTVEQLKKGKGLDEPEESNLFEYLGMMAAKDIEGSKDAAVVLKYIGQKRSFIKNTLGEQYKTWRQIIPEEYTAWQPREGNHLFIVYSLPEKMAEQLLEGLMPETIITKEQLKTALVKGMPFEELVIPNEVAKTLDNLINVVGELLPDQMLKKATNAWKVWQLISPRRFIKYNFRNLSGDADHVLAGNPKVFGKSRQAATELFDVMYRNKPMTDNLRDWFERGGFQSTLQVQEMGDISKLKHFIELYDKKDKNIVNKIWKRYWDGARLATDFREAILRYAAYLEYSEQIKNNNGKPKDYGASIPEEIDAIKDVRDKAFKLSNELLGAYDDVSVFGQWLRKNAIPFYSWMEVNPKIYFRLLKNALRNDELCFKIGMRTMGVGAKNAIFAAIKIGKFILAASAFTALLQAYNLIFHSEEEEELPKSAKEKTHVIFGRGSDGKIYYFDRLGALGDVLDWIGADTFIPDLKDFLSGRLSIKEWAMNMFKSPVNKLANAAYPFHRLAYEMLTKKSLYPDIFKPGNIRSNPQYFFRSFGLEDEYKAIMGLPQRDGSYLSSLKDITLYSASPEESAYWDIMDTKYRWQEQNGKSRGGSFYEDKKSNALYNYKLALRYKDAKAAEKYLAEYMLHGGTEKGLKTSLESMNPLAGLSDADKADFINSLTSAERGRLATAMQFYLSELNPEAVTDEFDRASSKGVSVSNAVESFYKYKKILDKMKQDAGGKVEDMEYPHKALWSKFEAAKRKIDENNKLKNNSGYTAEEIEKNIEYWAKDAIEMYEKAVAK